MPGRGNVRKNDHHVLEQKNNNAKCHLLVWTFDKQSQAALQRAGQKHSHFHEEELYWKRYT